MQKMFSDAMECTRTDDRCRLVRARLNGPTMGTRWSVSCDVDPQGDVQALERSLAAAVERVDRQMSPWKADSDLSRLNRAAGNQWIDLPEEMVAVLERALEVSRRSGGAFDPGVGALVNAWGFGAVRDVPDPVAIRAVASMPGRAAHEVLELDAKAGRVRKHAPIVLDLCAIAKGYGVDRMAAVVRDYGIEHALVALDGELRACGTQASGEGWAVALESPRFGVRAAHGVIELADLAAATSGDYRRSVHVGAVRLSHTMDARRAAPVHNDLASVTVLAPDCMSADAWATALLVAGAVDGPALAQRMGLEVLFLLRRADTLVEIGLGRFGMKT